MAVSVAVGVRWHGRGSHRGDFSWAAGYAVGVTFDRSVDVFQLSVVKSVSVSVGVSMCVSVAVAMVSSVDDSVGDRGVPWYTVYVVVEFDVKISVELVVEVAVESALAFALGLRGVRYLPQCSVKERGMSVETRGNPTVARGVSPVICGTPSTWPLNAAEVDGHYRGAPPKKRLLYMPPRELDSFFSTIYNF